MVKPIVAVTVGAMTSPISGIEHSRYYLERNYVDRLNAAGASVILVPPTTDVALLAGLIDGWLIPGGDDFDPSAWGEELHPKSQLESRERTDTERQLWGLISKDLPVFGICYGCQFINVARGGSLHQHLPDIVGDDRHRGYEMQDYRVEAGTLLGSLVGDSAQGRSSHHQAVNTTGSELRIVARHEDGTVEAVEDSTGRWILGVQWHPERSEVDTSERLFVAFVEAAREFRSRRGA